MQTLMSLLLSYFSEGFKTMYLSTHDKQDFYQHVGYCFCKQVVSCGAQSSNLPKHFVSIIFQVHYSKLNSNICRFHGSYHSKTVWFLFFDFAKVGDLPVCVLTKIQCTICPFFPFFSFFFFLSFLYQRI